MGIAAPKDGSPSTETDRRQKFEKAPQPDSSVLQSR
jgi:hypothetical protein